MPAISLVICVYQQRDFLARLLSHSEGCFDELIVVHDGPDTAGVREIAEKAGGRFFERPRECQQEPHWPFGWGEARHNWILRLDADEFPGNELKQWLIAFRTAPEPPAEISGHTCIWPLWDGRKAVSQKWPADRLFFFHKQRVRFFGMCEQTPVPDGRCLPLDFILHHQPERRSHSLANVLLREDGRRVARIVARSLLKMPADLVCWRWESQPWPAGWEQIRRHPLKTAVKRLIVGTLRGMRDQWRREKRVWPVVAFSGPVHHALICVKFWRLRRWQR